MFQSISQLQKIISMNLLLQKLYQQNKSTENLLLNNDQRTIILLQHSSGKKTNTMFYPWTFPTYYISLFSLIRSIRVLTQRPLARQENIRNDRKSKATHGKSLSLYLLYRAFTGHGFLSKALVFSFLFFRVVLWCR